MADEPQIQRSAVARKRKRPFQFGLIHLLAAPLVLAVIFALIHYLGFPCVLFLAAFSLAGGRLLFTMTGERPFTGVDWVCAVGLVLGIIALLLPALENKRPAMRRLACGNQLKQVALALHNYHDRYRCFPPAYVADKNGKPMHSWRVLILPYLEQESLYKQYRFDEPWDGPNNSRLAGMISDEFRCIEDTSALPTDTSYVVIVGPATAWPGARCVRLGGITDGPSNTILVVEVQKSGISWMEPRDLTVGQMSLAINPKKRAGISSGHPGGANVAFADGSVHFLPDDLPPGQLRALLTAAGGEPGDERPGSP